MSQLVRRFETDVEEESFLPDFCEDKNLLVILLIAELVAAVLALSHWPSPFGFWVELARNSALIVAIAMVGTWALCSIRRWVQGIPTWLVGCISILLLCMVTFLMSLIVLWFGKFWQGSFSFNNITLFPVDARQFIIRNVVICFFISALLLRYFYVNQQWRVNLQRQARARLSALQARIRPHFFFNSMNTIASLTRTNPKMAEQATEDLAELFRNTLRESDHLVELREDIHTTQVYVRIEQLRLGDRLKINWTLEGAPLDAKIPPLTLQPLVENSIRHGIETLTTGGTINITVAERDNKVFISINNAVAAGPRKQPHKGHRLALANIKERLALNFSDAALMTTEEKDGEYTVNLLLPLRENAHEDTHR